MIKFNKDTLRDKIHACFIGKNIGGTMGAPYEGSREIHDIKGYATPPGRPLPNDDLDLQLVWLRAIAEHGRDIDSKILGEYWTNFVGPHWNEYGNCKANMRAGLIPPLSGSVNNDDWKHSNGAWIRTEIWACTNPGLPDRAIRYAFEDASVDHGFAEGTTSAIFIAAIESAAFIINDIRTLINIGLSKIPEDCRVARSVKIVLDCYDNGIDWVTARNRVVEDSADLGWFQAPANIAFTVLGLVYGEGDFKKSMILAINCGDDTDCTGATLGSILGIIGGTAVIPDDWREYIGDDIVTVAVVRGTGCFLPATSSALTDCIMRLIPVMTCPTLELLAAGKEHIRITDGEDDFSAVNAESFCGRDFCEEMFRRSEYSFTVSSPFAPVLVEFDREPVINEGGSLSCRISVLPNTGDYFDMRDEFELHWYLPEGWKVEGRRTLFGNGWNGGNGYPMQGATADVTIIAGEKVEPINRFVLEVRRIGHAMPTIVPMTILS